MTLHNLSKVLEICVRDRFRLILVPLKDFHATFLFRLVEAELLVYRKMGFYGLMVGAVLEKEVVGVAVVFPVLVLPLHVELGGSDG